MVEFDPQKKKKLPYQWSDEVIKFHQVRWLIGTFGTANSNGELTSAGTASIAQESALKSGQDAVFDARSVDAHFAGIGRTHHTQRERTAVDGIASVFDVKTVPSVLLRFDVQTVRPVAVVH